jgi:tryptophan synthase alpha chain
MGRVRMRRIGACFRELRARGEKALVPFVTAGHPDLATTGDLVLALEDAGADVLEIGVPFSDPIAEGPTIQRSSERALAQGVSLRRILELVKGLRARTELPLVLMGYANPFYALGEDACAAALGEAGVDGIVVPDLPPEEGAGLFAKANERGIDGILLAAPTTRPERAAWLARRTRGFLYYVSLTGVTGARSELAADLEQGVRRVRESSDVPVCVGFGVSTPEHARAIARFADGVVVGSALVARIEEAKSRPAALEAATRFVRELKTPLRP